MIRGRNFYKTIEFQEATLRQTFIRFIVEDQFQWYFKKNESSYNTISKELTVSRYRDVTFIVGFCVSSQNALKKIRGGWSTLL